MDANKPSRGVLDKCSVEQVVTEWINAIENFRTLYIKLIVLIPHQSEKLPSPLFIGQCPADTLVTLVVTMQKELEQLLGEMDALNEPTTQQSPQTLRKLTRHTQRLNKLVEKAQVRLQLVNISSS